MQEELIREVVGAALNLVVHSKARAVANEGINYSILVVLLGLQYALCNSTDCEEESFPDLFKKRMSNGFMAPAIVAFSYGLIISFVTALHAYFFISNEGDAAKPSKVEKIYEFTSKFHFFGLDSLLEIPLSFIFAPIMTLFIWAIFGGLVMGFLFALSYVSGQLEELSDVEYERSFSIYLVSSFLVVIALLKLTGEIMQYYVIYKVAKSNEITNEENIELVRTKYSKKKNIDGS